MSSCGRKWKTRCKYHNLACEVQVEFGTHDSRSRMLNDLKSHGAPSHNYNSEHRCRICERERQESREKGWYQVDPYDRKVKPVAVIERDRTKRGN